MTALAAIETSTRRGSVAVLIAGDLREVALASERAHASDLLPALDRLLAEAGTSVRDLDAVAVGLGPGSYTGLRVAAATALGLARGADLALVGVPSFELAAAAALAPGEEGSVVQDARSGAIYHARYACPEERRRLRIVLPPAVGPPEEVGAALVEDGPLIGDEAALRALGLGPDAATRLRPFAPGAGELARRAAARLADEGPTRPEDLEPLYLRPFAARTRKRT